VPGPWSWAAAAVLLWSFAVPAHASSPSRAAPSLPARLFRGVRPGVTLDGHPVGLRTREEVRALLDAWARAGNRPPVNATLDRVTGAVVPERDGRRLDVRATEERVFRARPYERVHSVWRVWRARWRAQDMARLTETLGTYTTWIDGTEARRHNIVLASRRINHTVVYPGEVFSFVATVGPISRRLGYRAAPTIQDGEMRPGLGGGICQVSTTLYNAARRAGLKIVERHHHALPVHYVPKGMDATVVVPLDPPIPGVPVLDLRFQNPYPTPVVLHEVVNGWKVTAWVQGLSQGGTVPRAPIRRPSP
jgi:vancomycin resistance protein YoaR